MQILGIKPYHDGTLALLEDGQLRFSIENEKNSQPRMSGLGVSKILEIAQTLPRLPEAIAVGGWHDFESGYFDAHDRRAKKIKFFGQEVLYFTSSHARSHIMGTYGLSPYPQGQECYLLNWEGTSGSFYKIDKQLNVTTYPSVLSYPGYRYKYLYYLASTEDKRDDSMAGKLMALAAWPNPTPPTDAERNLVAWLLNPRVPEYVEKIWLAFPPKQNLQNIPWINGGLEMPAFRSLARYFSDALFQIFHDFAKAHLKERIPLLITGGCGLNCEWNTKWRDSNLFESVFVAPCANDSGSAIGTAVDAQYFISGNAKIEWNVFSGEDFIDDCETSSRWRTEPLDLPRLAALLADGQIVAWIQGKYEIGPRALGHRSLLAEPFSAAMRDRLNEVKKREPFRPIAPICLEEDTGLHFSDARRSEYMLYFQTVKNPDLKAITHIDGSARLQTISKATNEVLWNMLTEFKKVTGAGVLCNTSLNFNGMGFINQKSDLIRYAEQKGIKTLVIDNVMLTDSL